MKDFMVSTKEEMESRLLNVSSGLPLANQYSLKVAITRQTIMDIKVHLDDFTFADMAEEIEFYKILAPSIVHLEMLYSKLSDLEVERESLEPSYFRRYVKDELQEVQKFFEKRKFLYAYYLKGETDLDAYFFRRKAQDLGIEDSRLGTSHSDVLSQIMAFEQYRKALHVELDRKGTEKINGTALPAVRFEFDGSDADLAEIIPPIHLRKLIKINGKPATQEELLDLVDNLFNRQVKRNFSVVDNKNRARKKSQTPFMLGLIDVYMQRSKDLLK